MTKENEQKAFIITGPTSGFGRETAFELAKHGTVVLVGRSPDKLEALQREIETKGHRAVSVVCDLSDLVSARSAAAKISALKLALAGLVNNAGIMDMRGAKTAQGLDLSFVTNHLGPFLFTEALLPSLPDGANVVFLCSAVEDPERGPAKMTGFRGSRYISAEASARGEWEAGGSKLAGADAYATSKQCNLAAVMAFARENPRLRFNGVEPGIVPSTGLSRDANAFVRWLGKYVIGPLAPLLPYGSTPKRAARVITNAVLNAEGSTGVYFDERGRPMKGSVQVSDPKFQDRVVAETRALLSTLRTA